MATTTPRPGSGPRGRGAAGPPEGMLGESVRALWPSAARLEVRRDRRTPPDAVDYAVVPSVSAPRWLLPQPSRTSATALMGQAPDRRRQAGSHLLALAHRSGLVQRLPVRRLRVTGEGDSLIGAVRTRTAADAQVAVRLGSWPVARSVVLRVLRPDGSTSAYGKVGLDAHGRAAVTAEADALGHLRGLDLAHVVVPEVLDRFAWRGLEVLLVSPLVPPSRPSSPGLPVTAMLEVARSGGVRTEVLRASHWWAHARERLGAVTDPAVRAALAGPFDLLGEARLVVPLGWSHGDWTPWNMATVGDRVMLWDWEHVARDVPVGVDLVHHLAQQLRVTTGTDTDTEDLWLGRAEEALHRHVGLSAGQRDLALVAYLLEVNLRFVLDRQGTPEAAAARDGWGLPLLDRLARRLHEPT